MKIENIELMVKVISEIPRYEWERLKSAIDKEYENRARKIVLSNSVLLKKVIEYEFNL